jgi:hypothetical protein
MAQSRNSDSCIAAVGEQQAFASSKHQPHVLEKLAPCNHLVHGKAVTVGKQSVARLLLCSIAMSCRCCSGAERKQMCNSSAPWCG